MIEWHKEQLIAVGDVPRHLPRRTRSGKRIHVSAIYRWIQRGVRGVRLEAVRIGGSTYTSVEALQRFSERLTLARQGEPVPPPVSSAARRRQIEQASRRVAEILNPPKRR